ncbi:RNA polymerase sigma factor [Hamadaea tsunoensis]|uniref:RNA polymerase sigma factor n=1 Tax=Hamadaea tsunoensis TaxID=53368 RepID=UPI0004096097|nr:sigma-70 family RNA polymerase sigma factor [Hamadaea tsunoensis]
MTTERGERIGGLLLRARVGDRSALEEIVRELNPLLWHVARAQGLGTESAADVVQTTWLEFLRSLADIRTPAALTGWLVTAAQREAWRVRERERNRAVPDPEAVEAAVSPEPPVDEALLADERARVLWQAVEQLPEKCRCLLRVVAMADRPDYDLVSEALAMPRGSIGPTRGRCLAKLREQLLAHPAWSR